MASTNGKHSFTAPPEDVKFDGFLFDMDGTIIDSTEAIVKHWGRIGTEIGVDPAIILATSHGRRSIDMLKIYQPEKANWDYVSYMEGQIPLLYGDSAVEIPGARSLLDSLNAISAPWAIVTSGTRPLVTGWLKILGLPIPKHLVVAEDVKDGKPDPTCYLMGLDKLELVKSADNMEADVGKRNQNVLVLEDSPAGIRAGKAAGCKVVAVVTSHSVEEVVSAGADWVVRDLSSLSVVKGSDSSSIVVKISNALVST